MTERKAHTARRDALLRTMLRSKPAPRKADRTAEEIGTMIVRGDSNEIGRFAERMGAKGPKMPRQAGRRDTDSKS